MNRTRSFPQLLGIAALIVLIWTVFAVFNSSEFYRRTVDQDWNPKLSWFLVLCNQLVVSLNWALFTPVIVGIAERFPVVKPFRWRNAAVLLAVTPVLAVVRAAWGGAVLVFFAGDPASLIVYSVIVRWHRNVFLILVIFGVVNLVLVQRAAAAAGRKVLAEKKDRAHAELQRIRAALQPRFLFATLDAVKAQVAKEPEVADSMLVRLGAVLRKMLEFEKREDVSLAEELQLVDHCLGLERARTAGLFTTSVDVDEPLLRARIPPLLLHSIVESAVLARGSRPGRLEIAAWVANGSLRVSVSNDDPHRAPGAAALEAARARLQRTFGDRAGVEVRTHRSGLLVTQLSMPFERDFSGGMTRPSTVGKRREPRE